LLTETSQLDKYGDKGKNLYVQAPTVDEISARQYARSLVSGRSSRLQARTLTGQEVLLGVTAVNKKASSDSSFTSTTEESIRFQEESAPSRSSASREDETMVNDTYTITDAKDILEEDVARKLSLERLSPHESSDTEMACC
jgi:hypothetical protein